MLVVPLPGCLIRSLQTATGLAYAGDKERVSADRALGPETVLGPRPGMIVPALVGVEFGRRAADSFGSRLELEHRVSSNIVLRAGYGVQSLELERSGRGLRSQLSSDADLVFRVAPHTTLRMQVGPRYIEGSFSAH